ncbi:MAG TPA: hypothetical protein VKQ54_16730 [Caulobacteraceae bacterium]|nr:hypothetical protein [Caulobacteraceae bacterium]
MSGERGTSHRTHWLLGVWLAFAATAMVLACWGWYLQSGAFRATGFRRLENAVYMTLRVFSLSDAYTSASNTGGRWQLLVARWMGATVFLSGVATAGVALFQAQLASLAAGWRRHHVLIIGDHDMAFALALEAGTRRLPTIHMTATIAGPARRIGDQPAPRAGRRRPGDGAGRPRDTRGHRRGRPRGIGGERAAGRRPREGRSGVGCHRRAPG